MFADNFENMLGYNLGVFKQAAIEVVVLACDDEWLVTDSHTISRFSRIEENCVRQGQERSEVSEEEDEVSVPLIGGELVADLVPHFGGPCRCVRIL